MNNEEMNNLQPKEPAEEIPVVETTPEDTEDSKTEEGLEEGYRGFWRNCSKATKTGIIAGALGVLAIAIVVVFLIVGLDKWPRKVNVKSDILYVDKVENLPKDFIFGMDASCVPALEASGVKYYDFKGAEQDVYKILSDNGVNYIRVRIWNDPFDENGNGYGGGNCDIENAVKIGKRATKHGMKLLVNFHYSDFWADPAKQMVPKAWVGMSVEQKANAIYKYTRDCLKKLVDAGVDVGMVQIGNETNGYMCGEKKWTDIAVMMSAGSKAVREMCPKALVAVHFTNPEKATNYKNYAYQLAAQGVDYDVFASSYYPAWHGTLENLTAVLNQVADTYGKKTMIAETAYVNTLEETDYFGNGGMDGVKLYPFTEQGQANHIRTLTDVAVNQMHNCIGIFYWEGTWISVGGESWEENSPIWEKYGSGWASSFAGSYDPNDAGKYYGGCSVDNQAFFDKNGKVRESLKVFGLMRKGNIVENKADAIEDVNLVIDLNGDIILPDKVYAVMLDNSKQLVDVEWHNVDYDMMKNGGVAKYTILGTANGMTATCNVSMVEYNFLQNWSFDDGAPMEEIPVGWTVNAVNDFDELWVEDKVSDSLTGTKHYHFWGSKQNSVEFYLEQSVSGLKAGKYKYKISTMGGDCGDYEAYAYVKINGETVATVDAGFTVYDEWHTTEFVNFEINEGDVVTVGIYVKCQGTSSGAWGKIDDALLNSVTE